MFRKLQFSKVSQVAKKMNFLLAYFGIRIVRKSSYSNLIDRFDKRSARKETQEFISAILASHFSDNGKVRSLNLIEQSKAQLFQDLVVLLHLEFKTHGFFVEFGATDGITLSNTYLLEKSFSWMEFWLNQRRGGSTACARTGMPR